ncbi:hypothetical protein [Aureivirga sp. CE67]|uniref:hypothetical protein n=1 Tax=Aureivirga sp. CE67 TaxID=1788983 RepID=UPI0018C95196|nr:hypothetical protein [Aureivirga sp. CE67]
MIFKKRSFEEEINDYHTARGREYYEKLNKKERPKKRSNKKLFTRLGFLLSFIIISGIIILVNDKKEKQNLIENGIRTKSLVTNAYREIYTPLYEGYSVDNFKIQYKFKTNDNLEIESFKEIYIGYFYKYFDSIVKAGDSITIFYNESNPKINMIPEKIYLE